jgi:3-hydroxyisobutyrate dehydrogenase-like beta-hydroxyacid dehydrogenase
LAASSPADVASKVETVLVSLPTPDIVKQVVLGAEGIAEGSTVKTYVDLSTTGPRVAAEVAAALAGKGIITLDAPVSGGVGGARKGTLAIMVSGPRNLCGELRQMFEVIGKYLHRRQARHGPVDEARQQHGRPRRWRPRPRSVVMGVKAGLDPRVMIEVINAGSGANTAIRDKFPKAVPTRSFDYGFATGLMYKDVKLCLDEAERQHTPMWVQRGASALAGPTVISGLSPDFTTVVQLVEQWAGVQEGAHILNANR